MNVSGLFAVWMFGVFVTAFLLQCIFIHNLPKRSSPQYTPEMEYSGLTAFGLALIWPVVIPVLIFVWSMYLSVVVTQKIFYFIFGKTN